MNQWYKQDNNKSHPFPWRHQHAAHRIIHIQYRYRCLCCNNLLQPSSSFPPYLSLPPARHHPTTSPHSPRPPSTWHSNKLSRQHTVSVTTLEVLIGEKHIEYTLHVHWMHAATTWTVYGLFLFLFTSLLRKREHQSFTAHEFKSLLTSSTVSNLLFIHRLIVHSTVYMQETTRARRWQWLLLWLRRH